MIQPGATARRRALPLRQSLFFLSIPGLALMLAAFPSKAGNFYAGTSPANVPWPGGIVPYEFTNTLTAAQQQTYLDGLREWELSANVKFVPHTSQTRWILFTYNTNGFDNVSVGYTPQVVSVSSLSRAQVGHEMGHSFGFTHENIRPDQANYLSILSNNITSGNLVWFQIDPTSVTNGAYDFESVMHLGWDFASTQPGVLATQQPKPPYFSRYQFRMGNLCLSPGDRAALRYLYGPPAVPLANSVTSTADAGPGSLRAAMYYVTDNPGAIVRFNIPTSDPGYSNGVFNLHLTGHLPVLATNGMVIDGSTQPGFTGKPLIVVDGSQIIPETFTSNSGLLIYSADNQVKNISFQGFNWNGVTLEYTDATNNTIAGCWLGLDSTGSNAAPNAFQGILFGSGASRNTIGGTNATARNVISGNLGYAIWMSDTNTTGNIILGNYIGTDANGSFAVANALGGIGIFTNGVSHVIGGTNPGARNVISGNAGAAIWLSGAGVSNNTVRGNFIGLNATGTAGMSNTFDGIYLINGASGNTIGGSSAGSRNVISGNRQYEIFISDPGTSNNSVLGNYIGTDVAGTNAIGTAGDGFGIGIWNGAIGNTIGGGSTGAGNLISGHGGFSYGIALGGVSGNVVQGNHIGTDFTGTNALANGFANVALWGGSISNLIGGVSAGAGNVIAFAGGPGVVLYDSGTTNNVIRGNSIFSNGGLGIDFNNDGVTLNHTGFLAGPNNLQNFPVITNAFGYAASTIVAGRLDSLASGTYFIDVYCSLVPDPSGYGQGRFYVGTVSVTTDDSGNATFACTNVAGNYSGQYFTATATAAGGDTSEFSADVLATNAPAPSAQFIGPLTWQTNGFVLTLALQTNFTYRLQAATNLAGPVVWTDLANYHATNSSLNYTDRMATNYRLRFYRVISP